MNIANIELFFNKIQTASKNPRLQLKWGFSIKAIFQTTLQLPSDA